MNFRSQKRARCRAYSGFSLVEMLMVISILSVVTTLGTTAFASLSSAWNEKRIYSELNAMTENVFETMRRDFADTLSAELSGVSVIGVHRDLELVREFPRTFNADDQFVIPIQGASIPRALVIPGSVKYALDRTRDPPKLVRTIGELGDSNPARNRAVLVPDASAVQLRAEYFDGNGQWAEQWDRPELPESVRVSLTLVSDDRPDVQIARKAVFLIHVR